MIIIPAIDIMEGRCVRLTQGERGSRKVYDRDPVETARAWEAAGAKRIHVVDLDGAFDGESENLAAIRAIAAAVKVPVEVGGGIRTAEAVATLLESGVSFVVIGTLAVEKPRLASELIEIYRGKIYIGIDARAGMVATHGWARTSTRSVQDVLERAGEWKARGIIFTAIERDGELVGPDFDAISDVASRSEVPVVASGGVTALDDLRKLSAIPHLEGVIVGKALYEGRFTIEEAIAAESD